MKAFLLAGGLGQRLLPLTEHIPKCLAPIDGVPLLEIWLGLCERHAVTHVLINVGRHYDLVESYVASNRRKVDVRLVREAAPIGTAGTILANRSFVAHDDSFFILYADNLTDVALDRLAAFHAAHDAPLTMGLLRTARPEAAGIVTVRSDGLITAFTEKPSSPAGNLANAGVYVARQSLFSAIPIDRPVVDFGHDVLPALVGRMYGVLIDEFLIDIGDPDALALGSRQWAERKTPSRLA